MDRKTSSPKKATAAPRLGGAKKAKRRSSRSRSRTRSRSRSRSSSRKPMRLVGSRAMVWHGTALKTAYGKKGLKKKDLMFNKKTGRIVSKAKHALGVVAFRKNKKMMAKPFTSRTAKKRRSSKKRRGGSAEEPMVGGAGNSEYVFDEPVMQTQRRSALYL